MLHQGRWVGNFHPFFLRMFTNLMLLNSYTGEMARFILLETRRHYKVIRAFKMFVFLLLQYMSWETRVKECQLHVNAIQHSSGTLPPVVKTFKKISKAAKHTTWTRIHKKMLFCRGKKYDGHCWRLALKMTQSTIYANQKTGAWWSNHHSCIKKDRC